MAVELDTCNKLEQLFLACDTKGTGLIDRDEMRELCRGFAISPEDSDMIFSDLDRDGDGKLNFEDFCKGFRDTINTDFASVSCKGGDSAEAEGRAAAARTDERRTERREHGRKARKAGLRRRDSLHHAFIQFSKTYGEENVLQYLGNSQEKIHQLYQELLNSDTDPGIRKQVESVLGSLLNEVKQLHDENKQMEKVYMREKETHEDRLRTMEEELEAQVAKVDAQARMEAEQKKEQEIKEMEMKMKEEIAELQMHLRMFQKVDGWLQKDTGKEQSEETQRKLEEATQENRNLKMTLTEAETGIALMRAEMTQIRSQYEEKCSELHSERAQLEEYVARQQQLQRQAQLLQEANRRIQDTNDSLRQTLQPGPGRQRPLQRPPSQLSSVSDPAEGAGRPAAADDVQYGIPRLMRDLDSSLRDPDETDSGICRSGRDDADLSFDRSLRDDLDDYDVQQNNGIDELMLSSSDQYMEPRLSPRGSPLQRRHQAARPAGWQSPSRPQMAQMALYEPTGPPDRTYKVVFAGDAAVGKSTFITRICKGVFVTNISSTLGVDFQVKTLCVDDKNVAIQLWDTAGQERFRSITKSYFRRADGVMLLYDVTSERSFLNVRQWVQNIDEVTDSRVPIMLCSNKCDMRPLLQQEGKPCLSREQGETLARQFGAHFHETSAKTGEGMLEAVVELGRRMLTNEDVEVQTSALKVAEDTKKNGNCSSGNAPGSCKK